jgi:hypothetical protein
MPSDLQTSTIPYLIVIGVTDVISLYAAYLAFSIWRGLVVPIYRSRALWNGALAILFGLGFTISGNVDLIFGQAYGVLGVILAYLIVYPGAQIVLFIWIDRTMNTIIRLDYQRRDVARWRSLRFVYWAFAAATLALYAILFATNSSVVLDLFLISFLFPLSYGSLALILGARKTRDMTFKLHARWFGFAIAALIVVTLTPSFVGSMLVNSLPYILVSFCVYKMARFLVPIDRFPNSAGQ